MKRVYFGEMAALSLAITLKMTSLFLTMGVFSNKKEITPERNKRIPPMWADKQTGNLKTCLLNKMVEDSKMDVNTT